LWPPLCVSTTTITTLLTTSFIIPKVLVEYERADAGDGPPPTKECDEKRGRWGGDGLLGVALYLLFKVEMKDFSITSTINSLKQLVKTNTTSPLSPVRGPSTTTTKTQTPPSTPLALIFTTSSTTSHTTPHTTTTTTHDDLFTQAITNTIQHLPPPSPPSC
jgi:hypothetical protein